MEKITKLQILLTINQMKMEDLAAFAKSGEITIEEMTANGLSPDLARQIDEQISRDRQKQVTEAEMINTCKKVQNGEMNAGEIKKLLLDGSVKEELLLKHTTLTCEMVEKIKNYQKQQTPFLSWKDLPPLQKGYTDLYFFGQPGSGKSCILASIFHYLDSEGMVINNVHNTEGFRYRNQLTNEISYGILPDSTAAEGVNYIPIELINPEDKGSRHPINFIEMSGELFNRAYDGGISSENLAARDYLNNTNKKMIYFVLDYDQHEKTRNISTGPTQSSKMQTILALLDDFGTLHHTDGINIVVTKSDLFPPGVDRYQYSKQFLENNYKSFLVNCKELQKKYRDRFKIIVYPYSIGRVMFQNMLVELDTRSPKEIVEDILTETFVTKRSFLGKFFS